LLRFDPMSFSAPTPTLSLSPSASLPICIALPLSHHTQHAPLPHALVHGPQLASSWASPFLPPDPDVTSSSRPVLPTSLDTNSHHAPG
jgi:hypothetical protein